MRPGREWSRDELCELFWPGDYVEVSKDRLRQNLALLNKALRATGAESPIQATRTSICLPSSVSVDLTELRANSARSTPDIGLLRELGGEFCPGFTEDWIQIERDRIRREWQEAGRITAGRLLGQGSAEEALAICEDVIAVDRLYEPIQELRVRAFLEGGRSISLTAATAELSGPTT